MQFVIFIVPFFVFLFLIYKLVKDDYVFIRKGILPEQTFDITFLVVLFGLVISRLLSLVFQYGFQEKVILSFFSGHVSGLSLLGFVFGSLAVLAYMGKKKKIILGRFFDFFTLAFLPSLAIGYLLSGLFVTGYPLTITLIYGVIYLLLTFVFFYFFKPQLLSRTIKEGSITLFFLTIFALFSLIHTLFLEQLGHIMILRLENVFSLLLFLGSIVLYFKQEGGRRR